MDIGDDCYDEENEMQGEELYNEEGKDDVE